MKPTPDPRTPAKLAAMAAKKTAKKKTAKAGAKKAPKKAAKKAGKKQAGKKPATKKKKASKAAKKVAKKAAKKTAAKPAAKQAAAKQPAATAKKTAPAKGGVSSLTVHMGQVFALRPRVAMSFRPDDFREARYMLQDEAYADAAEAARAVAEKALDLTRGSPPSTKRGSSSRRW